MTADSPAGLSAGAEAGGPSGDDRMATRMAGFGEAGADNASFWAMMSLAAAVPCVPHCGHLTSNGMRPSTGSTSNEYRAPQAHCTLISISRFRVEQHDVVRKSQVGGIGWRTGGHMPVAE